MSLTETANKIYNIECPTLDIGERTGGTGYIDFIKSSEFPESFRKGIDKFGRKFISFRADIHYANGGINETLTTLFQRSNDYQHLWMAAGDVPKTKLLFDTIGGANINQLELVYNLLQNGHVNLTEDESLEAYKLEPFIKIAYNYHNPEEDPGFKPVKIVLKGSNVLEDGTFVVSV